MRIALATDAWQPQINGVVRTLASVVAELRAMGHVCEMVTPEGFPGIPCPGYASIRLACWPFRGVSRQLDAFRPEAVHIATEGPVGLAARRWCRRRAMPFTTSYHTRFPEYLRLRAPVPVAFSYALLRRFHGAATRTLVPTVTQQARLREHGFERVSVWSRGVDTDLFRPGDKGFLDLPRPIAVTVGRVAVEKNLPAFLDLDLPGTRLVIGDGPDLERMKARYPGAVFTGFKQGPELARYLAASDVFVFPSRTDTFGLVLLEAMACGVPVAAYPVTGPIDVVRPGETGVLGEDLREAVLAALALDGDACVAYARSRSWRGCAEQFLGFLQPREGIPPEPGDAAQEASSSRV